MDQKRIQDTTLLVVGHGSTVNEDSRAPVFYHAERLRQLGMFAEVRECFVKQEPYLGAVLDSVRSRRVFVAPLFVSSGYFTEQVIPRLLGLERPGQPYARSRPIPGGTLFYCKPVGTHPSITEALVSRAQAVLLAYPLAQSTVPRVETTLFLVGHGTPQYARSRQTIEHHAQLIRERHLFADVSSAFLEEPPLIRDIPALTATRNAVVVPCFISDGLHTFEDIPVMLGASDEVVKERRSQGLPPWQNPTEVGGKRIWYAETLGHDPMLTDIILQRVAEAAASSSRESTD